MIMWFYSAQGVVWEQPNDLSKRRWGPRA